MNKSQASQVQFHLSSCCNGFGVPAFEHSETLSKSISLFLCPNSAKVTSVLDVRTRVEGPGVADEGQGSTLAYTFFTSGTTGKPKGVMATWRNTTRSDRTLLGAPGLTTSY